jgi:hypothetical protein
MGPEREPGPDGEQDQLTTKVGPTPAAALGPRALGSLTRMAAAIRAGHAPPPDEERWAGHRRALARAVAARAPAGTTEDMHKQIYGDGNQHPTSVPIDPDFDDDPLSAGGFGPADATIAVRPGPVRTTLIRPRVPRLTRRGTNDTFDISENEDHGAWIQRFLTFFQFGDYIFGTDATGQRCMFNDATSTVGDVIDVVQQQGRLDGYEFERVEVMKVASALMLRPPGVTPQTITRTLYMSYTFVPWTGHADLAPHPNPSIPKTSSDKPGQQLGGQVTFELHPKSEPGWEISLQGQLTSFRDDDGSYHVQSGALGGQAAYVGDAIDDILQIGWFNQVLGGAARSQSNLDGVIKLAPIVQVASGFQFMLSVPGTKGVLSIGGQLAPQFTGAIGSNLPKTFDFTTGVVLQVKLGSSK